MADDSTKPSSDTDGDDQMHGFLTRAIREADARPSFSMELEPLDAAMEAQGGAAAARWRSVKDQGQAFQEYQAAATAYRLAQDLPRLKTEVIAALRLAEGALTRTPLTRELEQHGWSPRFISYMADLLADYRDQVEKDTFQLGWDVGYGIGRTMLEEISPMWYDLDEIKEAVNHAKELLRAYQVRLESGG
jgi:hypothetical protein